ncbi:SurA N-terminal domain-containing protein [Ruania zhangjianzhongii]|uniref:SurA N-terminal domain-containing protein n=1 Tax=Ruania zhangjianzhongii TaxID=2603206 RepID=UPI0011CAAC7B|nr:SurA N-terminal domain-containing protein [Ruania zhangjianzhongii]
MKITRPLTAVGVATLLALAGCSSGDDGSGNGGSEQPSEAASDPAAAPSEGGMQAPEADLENVPDVVAEVNGEEITRDEFAADYESQLQQAAMMQQQSGEEVNQDELKQQVAQTMVDNRLLTQAADEAGIEPTEEDINSTLEDIAAQSGMGSADEVVAALEEQGMTEEDVRAEAADQFQVLGYIESEADISEPSEDELRQQYEGYVEQMEQSGQGGEGGEVPPFEEMRDQLAQQAVTQQQNAAAEEILTGLREEGNVTINL